MQQYKYFASLFLCIFMYCSVSGQNRTKIDSLWNMYHNTKQDSTRIKVFIDIGENYENNIPDSAILYFQKALDLSETNFKKTKNYHFLSFKANSLRNLGIVNLRLDKYDIALRYNHEALEIYKSTGEKVGIATCYNNIGIVYEYEGNYKQSLKFFQKALKIYHDIGDKKGMASTYTSIGLVNDDQGNYEEAIDHFQKALKINKVFNNKQGMATCYNNLGIVYDTKGNYDQANESNLKALRINEELGNKKGIANSYNNLGIIQEEQSNYDKALNYYMKSLKMFEELENKSGIANSRINIGIVYYFQNNFKKAELNYQKALKISEEIGNKNLIDVCFSNLGEVNKDQGNYKKAIEFDLKALKLDEESGDKNGLATDYIILGSLNLTLADSTSLTKEQKINYLKKAIEYNLKAIKLAKEIKAVPRENDAAKNLMDAYKKLGDFKKAEEYAEIFILTKDSMFSEEKTKALAEMSTKYEAEKKQLKIDNLNKENKLKKAELAQSEEKRNKQLILIYTFIVGFIIIIVFSIIILRLFMQKKKANIILAKQKQQIEIQNSKLNQANEEITAQRDEITAQRDMVTEQKEHIEVQKKEIDDSIRYAKRIQQAVMPKLNLTEDKKGFVLFKPKDVVSGDFYWTTQTEEWTIVTVADCTGHGVPGAFMSMLGVSFLNEIVRKEEVTNTGEVLNQLRASVIDALKQTGEEGTQKDGMDMSIIAIHKDRKKAMWSGANNPLYLLRNHEIQEIKGDKMPVAVHTRMESFTNHEITLKPNDKLYLFSDGFPDQFGGQKGKKFKYVAFKNLLTETSDIPMKEQGTELEKTLHEWMNFNGQQYEQIDDITVLGIKI